ncbi:MAG TPA: VOC family protein [Polyangiales bacterium]
MAFIATRDATRAKGFYQGVLGLRLLAEEPYALVFDAHGTKLRIQKVGPFRPHPFTSLGWEVSDIRATLRALIAHGVEPMRYPHLPADELGVWDAGAALVAWFHDPDGNLLSLTEHAREPGARD